MSAPTRAVLEAEIAYCEMAIRVAAEASLRGTTPAERERAEGALEKLRDRYVRAMVALAKLDGPAAGP